MERAACRFYAKQYPVANDVVMCKVHRTDDASAYVYLLEYNNIEGMIPFTELSRRRIRSLTKSIRVGKQEAYQVMSVDAQKGYIDLSKRKVTPEDVKACEDRYNKAKTVRTIFGEVHRALSTPAADGTPPKFAVPSVEYVYERIGWPLAAEFGNTYDALRLAMLNPAKVFEHPCLRDAEGKPPDAAMLEALLAQCRVRLKAHPFKIRAKIECTCLTPEGILAIKDVLGRGEKASTEEHAVKIKLDAPPHYFVTTISADKEAGIAHVNSVVEQMVRWMEEKRGSVKLLTAPVVVSDEHDHHVVPEGYDDDDDDDDDEEDEEDEEDEGEGDEGDDAPDVSRGLGGFEDPATLRRKSGRR